MDIREEIVKELTLLKERVIDIESDVDLIYDMFFKRDIDELTRTGIITRGMFNEVYSDTSILRSEKGREANMLMPCQLRINVSDNTYNTLDKIISLGVNKSAIEYVRDTSGNFMKAVKEIRLNYGIDKSESIVHEFTSWRIKGSIHHELYHWLDDVFHNNRLGKIIDKRKRDFSGKKFTRKDLEKDNIKPHELQAQIGNIQQLKKEFGDIWDVLTFSSLLYYSPPLNAIYNHTDVDDRGKWLRDIRTRMSREGLLGKNMVKF
jgi:hypothetical protein